MIAFLSLSVVLLLIILVILSIRMASLYISLDSMRKDIKDIMKNDSNIHLSTLTRDRRFLSFVDSLDQELENMRKTKREYNLALSEIYSGTENIAHDLRTPLTSIRGYISLLEECRLGEEEKRYLKIIKDRSDYMKGLTDELFLSFSMKNTSCLNIVECDIKSVLEEALVSLEVSLEKKGIIPQVMLPEERIIKRADPKALYRVYVNVIENALKYSEGDFSVSMDEEGRVCFRNFAPHIDSVDISLLFGREYTIKRGKSSSGLGLNIAKTLMEKMGGGIKSLKENDDLLISVFF